MVSAISMDSIMPMTASYVALYMGLVCIWEGGGVIFVPFNPLYIIPNFLDTLSQTCLSPFHLQNIPKAS